MYRIASALLLASCICHAALASTFFFPGNQPAYAFADAPRWLREGHGNDGYLTVTSEVIPASSCVPLSNHSFWGGEKTQLVLSVTTNGFKKSLNAREIPIAAFDGRDNGSECASLSTLPIEIVPLATLNSFSSYNPGELSIVLNVKSASDSNQDFIGSAKLLLGAAAMVVTGGTANAIGGIAATVDNPVLTEAQNRTNKLMQGMVNGKTQLTLSWPKIRSGIRTIEIPVYRAESGLGSSAEKQIQQLQSDNRAGKTVLFTVRLSFGYIRTLFDPAASGSDQLPSPDSVSTANVLNYQPAGAQYNFLQMLNDTSPSLLQAIAGARGQELKSACSVALDKMKKSGLSNLDTAIVLKSFLDEAKGGTDWYTNPATVKSCFEQAPAAEAFLERIYGVSAPKFVVGDIQEGIGKSYRNWRDLIGPALSNFRKALLAKTDRANALIDFNARRDIKLTFSPEVLPWPQDDAHPQYPGISALANRQVRTIACFIYKDPENLNPGNPGAYFILEDSGENFWLNSVKLASDGSGKIASIGVSELSPDWEKHFESYSYPGGECATVLGRARSRLNDAGAIATQ